jgi:hypothetical protein
MKPFLILNRSGDEFLSHWLRRIHKPIPSAASIGYSIMMSSQKAISMKAPLGGAGRGAGRPGSPPPPPSSTSGWSGVTGISAPLYPILFPHPAIYLPGEFLGFPYSAPCPVPAQPPAICYGHQSGDLCTTLPWDITHPCAGKLVIIIGNIHTQPARADLYPALVGSGEYGLCATCHLPGDIHHCSARNRVNRTPASARYPP